MFVSQCCGCFSVKTGVLIIAIINMICSLVAILSLTVQMSGFLYFIVNPLVHLVCSILLILGVQGRKIHFVFPSVCMYLFDIILVLPSVFMYQIHLAVLQRSPIWLYFVFIFITGIFFALLGYFFMVIKTFYEELLREKYTVSKKDDYLDVYFSNEPYHEHI